MSILRLDLNHLESVLDELGDQAEAAARPAAQAAAQVLYDQVKQNVAAIPQQTGVQYHGFENPPAQLGRGSGQQAELTAFERTGHGVGSAERIC